MLKDNFAPASYYFISLLISFITPHHVASLHPPTKTHLLHACTLLLIIIINIDTPSIKDLEDPCESLIILYKQRYIYTKKLDLHFVGKNDCFEIKTKTFPLNHRPLVHQRVIHIKNTIFFSCTI